MDDERVRARALRLRNARASQEIPPVTKAVEKESRAISILQTGVYIRELRKRFSATTRIAHA